MQSVVKRVWLYPLIFLPFGSLTGCASLPGMLQPAAAGDAVSAVPEPDRSTPEGQLLAAMSGAAPGVEILLPEGVRAVADEPYAAASGRTCRRARLDYPDGRVDRRLACEVGGLWQWAPAVTLQLKG